MPRSASLDALVAALQTEIEAGPATTILSSENFYLLCEPTAVQDLMARLTASPAVPSRWWSTCAAQDEAALSWYNQAVKAQGYAGYFEDHMATHQGLWDYHRHLQAWAGAFGRERMVVRRYDAGDDVRRDFMGPSAFRQVTSFTPICGPIPRSTATSSNSSARSTACRSPRRRSEGFTSS